MSDLSILQSLPKFQCVLFLDRDLPRRYWSKLSEWNPKWLLDEENADIRRVLIQQVGYERICQELDAIDLDIWREYSLLKIDGSSLLTAVCGFMGYSYLQKPHSERGREFKVSSICLRTAVVC